MLDLIGLLLTGGVVVAGYRSSRDFVRRRLRFVDAVQERKAPVVAGSIATLVAAPVVWILPLVGTGTALLFGASIAMGVRRGAKDIRQMLRG
jgi:hypothetical protein